MFNHSSDPWYTYMQPFRIVFLRKMIKAQHEASKAQHLAAKAQEEAKAEEEEKEAKEEEKEETVHS